MEADSYTPIEGDPKLRDSSAQLPKQTPRVAKSGAKATHRTISAASTKISTVGPNASMQRI